MRSFLRAVGIGILSLFIFPLLAGADEMRVEMPKMSEVALQFYKSGNWLWAVQQLFPLLLLGVIIFSGLSAKISYWAQRSTKKKGWQAILYMAIFGALLFLANLPLSYYADFVRPHYYGLSSQQWEKWLGNELKSAAITFCIGISIVLVIYALMRKSSKRWWIYASLLTLPFIILAVLVTPLWIEPLFNKFGPMKDKVLEAKILHLAECVGIEGGKVYEVDKSQDTSMVNAYVTGFGATKRIVLWDTIIAKLTPDELLFVMGHEMGHFVLHHIEKDILFQFLMSFLLFYCLSCAPFVIKKSKKYIKFNSVTDIASLPLLLLMSLLFFFITAPLSNAFSRYLECEADSFGLEVTQNNHAAATAFVKLQQENLGNPTPGPLFVFWRATHPPLAQRVEYCNTYQPWKEGKPLQFQSYIHKECQK